MPYKEDGTHFRSISRMTLFHGDPGLPVEARVFEILPGGHSTLERHDHLHLVMVVRGSGRVFVKDSVQLLGLHDVVHIPTQTWHQFRAAEDDVLDILCLVAVDRDRPHRPTPEEAAELKAIPGAEDFLRF